MAANSTSSPPQHRKGASINAQTTAATSAARRNQQSDNGVEATSTAAEEDLEAHLWDLRFKAAEARIYAGERASHLELVSHFLSFVGLLGGSAVIGSVATGGWALPIGLVIASSSALEVVFGFTTRAATWRRCADENQRIEIDVVDAQTEGQLKTLREKFWQIAPPPERTFRKLKRVSYTLACKELGVPHSAEVISKADYALRHWISDTR